MRWVFNSVKYCVRKDIGIALASAVRDVEKEAENSGLHIAHIYHQVTAASNLTTPDFVVSVVAVAE